MSSHKTFRIKPFLAKNQKQNHSIPQWIQMKTEICCACRSLSAEGVEAAHWHLVSSNTIL
ncbi:hypothetical protein H8959_017246 [Pygathrix nigripes]